MHAQRMWQHLMKGPLGTGVEAVAARRAVDVWVVALVRACLLRWREVESLLAWYWCPCWGAVTGSEHVSKIPSKAAMIGFGDVRFHWYHASSVPLGTLAPSASGMCGGAEGPGADGTDGIPAIGMQPNNVLFS